MSDITGSERSENPASLRLAIQTQEEPQVNFTENDTAIVTNPRQSIQTQTKAGTGRSDALNRSEQLSSSTLPLKGGPGSSHDVGGVDAAVYTQTARNVQILSTSVQPSTPTSMSGSEWEDVDEDGGYSPPLHSVAFLTGSLRTGTDDHSMQSLESKDHNPVAALPNLNPDDDDNDRSAVTRNPVPIACMSCRSFKVRCDLPPEGAPCKKCRSRGRECILTGPKPLAKREERIGSVAGLDRASEDGVVIGDGEAVMSGFGGYYERENDGSVSEGSASSSFSHLPRGALLPSTAPFGFLVGGARGWPKLYSSPEGRKDDVGGPGSGLDAMPLAESDSYSVASAGRNEEDEQLDAAESSFLKTLSSVKLPPVPAVPTPARYATYVQRNQKRRRSNNEKQQTDDEEDSQEEYDGAGRHLNRLRGVCANCKSLKVRCDFPPEAEACEKCSSSGKECIPSVRKHRKPPAKREDLIKQIRDKDAIISQLLEQLEAVTISSSTALANPTALSQSQPSKERRYAFPESQESGIDDNAPSGSHGTALQAACHQGHDAIVRLLLERGADINAHSERMGTALQAACHQGHDAIVRVLLHYGADVNAPSGNYGTALQAACHQGYDAIVRLLLEHGADVNERSETGGTALQAAAKGGQAEIMKLLLDGGADVNARTESGGSAFQATAEGGNEAVVRLSLEAGADFNTRSAEYGYAFGSTSSESDSKGDRTFSLQSGADLNKQAHGCETLGGQNFPICDQDLIENTSSPPFLRHSRESVSAVDTVQYVLAANGALTHLTQRESTIREILALQGISGDTHLLAGFDESLVRRGVGLLEAIYAVVSEEVLDPNALCNSLGHILCPYPGIVVTPTQSYRTKICGPDSSDEDNHVAIMKRTIQYTDSRSLTPPSTCILGSGMVSFQNEHDDQLKIPGGWNGGNTDSGVDRQGSSKGDESEKEMSGPIDKPPYEESRQGGQPSDPEDSLDEDQSLSPEGISSHRPPSEESENPDPKPITAHPTPPPFAYFNCKAFVFLGQNSTSTAENEATQRLRIVGRLECNSRESPTVGCMTNPTLNVKFTELAFEGISKHETITYRQILARVSMNVHDYDIIINSNPISTRTYDDTSKESFAVTKGSTTTGSGSVGWKAVPVFLANLAHTRANETSLSKEQVRCESRVIMYRMDEYVYWVLHVDDPNQQQTGLNLAHSPSRLPRAEFEFFRTAAILPTHVDIEVESFWSLLTGLESTKDLRKLQKRKLLNVSHVVQLKVPSNLSESSIQKPKSTAKVDCKRSKDITPETSNHGVHLRCGVNNVTKPRMDDVREGRSGLREKPVAN